MSELSRSSTTVPDRYDIFLSHASEDKERVARPLYEALTAEGISVWFDEATLELGDSLRRKIDEGLSRCRYGVVILSPRFLAKEWPQRELDGLVARETLSGGKAILPVWHELDASTLMAYSSPLADRLAARFDDGIDNIVEQIRAILNKPSASALPCKEKTHAVAAQVRSTASRWSLAARHWGKAVVALGAVLAGSLMWSWVATADDLIPGFGIAFPSRNRLDADLNVQYRYCTKDCLSGVARMARLRGSLGNDAFGVLNFWKPGSLLGSWYAALEGPHIRVRMATRTPHLGIEVTVKDAENDEARFRCSTSADGEPHDYILPRDAIKARAVDLSRIQLVAFGPSTSAQTPPGRFEFEFFGMVSAAQLDGFEECVGLLKSVTAILPDDSGAKPSVTAPDPADGRWSQIEGAAADVTAKTAADSGHSEMPGRRSVADSKHDLPGRPPLTLAVRRQARTLARGQDLQ